MRGFGLREGAFASTVAHDAHNIVVVGVADADMPACAAPPAGDRRRDRRRRGGAVRGELPLPVAGLLSDEPVEPSSRGSRRSRRCSASTASATRAPFMSLSFLALSVIPALKITDRGLVDVDRFALVPLEVS